jgi:nitrile hydratase
VLKEVGLDLEPSVELRVWDSSGHSRWFVVPQRPAGTEGLSEEELAALVTTESMIGIAAVPAPAA